MIAVNAGSIWKHRQSALCHRVLDVEKNMISSWSLPEQGGENEHGEAFYGTRDQFGEEFKLIKEAN